MSLPAPYYERDGIVLYCGDCLTLLPELPSRSVDAVVTDPPYGINHQSGHGASWMNTTIAGDSDTSVRDKALDAFETVAAFGTWKTPPISDTRGVLVWDKGPAFGMGDLAFPWKPSWELIYVRGKGWAGARDEGVLRGPVVVSWESRGRVHPHQKPTWIAEHLIFKVIGRHGFILDPFLGSGTTAVACIKTGRKCIGMEISEQYAEIAARRCEEAFDAQGLYRQETP